ncbi:MAG: hypothetical protein JWR39_2243 [Devosia sp.]|jgi:poly-gamma-glutamate system protein|nr:hypothetical protein [Devosia sp.]
MNRRFSPSGSAGKATISGLALAAALSLTVWSATEKWIGGLTYQAYPQMLAAAHTMESATQVARSQRIQLGLLQSRANDPNRTGLIGSEYTDTTTSIGELASKRTATNPDLAAALVKTISRFDLPAGTPVIVSLSGSFIGGDIATISAVEALELKPFLVSSLGSSMYGATDPELTWLDIEAELRREGVIKAKSSIALIGGGSAVGSNLMDEAVDALKMAAQRNGVELISNPELRTMLDEIEKRAQSALGASPALLINSGGSVLALGTCTDGHLLPLVNQGTPLPCTDGEPGLIVRAANAGIATIHLLNMRTVATDWNLPLDPIPLPLVGNNRAIYGAARE